MTTHAWFGTRYLLFARVLLLLFHFHCDVSSVRQEGVKKSWQYAIKKKKVQTNIRDIMTILLTFLLT